MITITWDVGRMPERLRKLDRETSRALDAIHQFQGARSTAWMKGNAPWTDRTGAARSGIHATSSGGGGSWEILFAHAVSYGIWLEIANSGRYQIILPAMRQAMGELQQLINGLWGRL